MTDERLIRVIKPGTSMLNAVAWSPDGTRLAIGSADGEVSVWTTEGRVVWRKNVHVEKTEAIVWSQDGKKVISADSNLNNSRLIVWSTVDGEILLQQERGCLTWGLCHSPDSAQVAVTPGADHLHRVQLVNTMTGESRYLPERHTNTPVCVDWSPNGLWIASAGYDGTIHIWSTETNTLHRVLNPEVGDIHSVAWSRDSRRIAASNWGDTVWIGDIDSASPPRSWNAYAWNNSLAWSPVSDHLAFGEENNAALLDLDTGEILARLSGHIDTVRNTAFSSDATRLASVSDDGTLRLWDVADLTGTHAAKPLPVAAAYLSRQAATVGRRPASTAVPWVPHGLPGAKGPCLGIIETPAGQKLPSVAVHPSGKSLATGSGDGRVRLWDLHDGTLRWEGSEHHADGVLDLDFAPDGQTLASASEDRTVRLWSATDGTALLHLDGHTAGVGAIAWSPDGRYLASAAGDHTARLWDPQEGTEQLSLGGHDIIVTSVSWSPDSLHLATGDSGDTTRIWGIADGRCLHQLGGGTRNFARVNWSPDGQALAAATSCPRSTNSTIRLWNPDTGGLLRQWSSHHDYHAVWSPDNRLLASAPNDQAWEHGQPESGVRIWLAETGQCLACFPYPESRCFRLTWSPDGAFLVSSHGNGDGTDIFRFWDTRPFLQSPTAFSSADGSILPAALRPLPRTAARLARLGLHPPLSLLQALDHALTEPNSETLPEPLIKHRGLHALRQLRWPRAARTGLLALLLAPLPLGGWRPPPELTPRKLREGLVEALAGGEGPVKSPPIPSAALLQAAERIDERTLALLTLLGPEAVAAEPGLPLRLASQIPKLPPMARERRRLLGMRLRLDHGSRVQGSGAGIEHAGVTLQGNLRALLPSQLLLPPELLHARWLRRELLYRARHGQEPPRLRPTVLLLDVTAPCFGPVEAVTRIAAHLTAATLIERGLPVVLVTTGEGSVEPLTRPADLLAVWTRRSLAPTHPRRALSTARAMARTLADGGPAPAVVLLSHPWFGADEPDLPLPEGLRALFVHYPGRPATPPLAKDCEQWACIPAGGADRLEQTMGRLVA